MALQTRPRGGYDVPRGRRCRGQGRCVSHPHVQRRPVSQAASSPPQGHRPRSLPGLRRVCSSSPPPFLSARANPCEGFPQRLGDSSAAPWDASGEPETLRIIPSGRWTSCLPRLVIRSTSWLREVLLPILLRLGAVPHYSPTAQVRRVVTEPVTP